MIKTFFSTSGDSMSNETESINKPMSLVQKSQSLSGDTADYFRTKMEDYPKTSSFYSSHSSPTLIRLAVFNKIVLIPWAVSTFLLTQGELKKHLANELASIKQIMEGIQ